MGEKKRRLAAGRAPGRLASTAGVIAQAFQALQRGDRRTAGVRSTRCRRRCRDARRAARRRRTRAAVGPLSARRRCCRARSSCDRRQSAYRCHLAIAHRRLAARPRDRGARNRAATRSGAGGSAFESGKRIAGTWRARRPSRSFERALAIRRDFPDALNGLGDEPGAAPLRNRLRELRARAGPRSGISRGRVQPVARAECSGRRASRALPMPRSLSAAAVAHAELGLESILAALQHWRDNPAYGTSRSRAASRTSICTIRSTRASAKRCCRRSATRAVDPARLVRPIASLVATHPAAIEIARLLPASAHSTVERGSRSSVTLAPFSAIHCCYVCSRMSWFRANSSSALLGFARRGLLRELSDGRWRKRLCRWRPSRRWRTRASTPNTSTKSPPRERGRWSCAAIAGARTTRTPVPLHSYAVYACYRPLETLSGRR